MNRSEGVALRQAHLITKDYKPVTSIVVPGDRKWPEAVRFEGRVFAIYPQTFALTMEAISEQDRSQVYREIEVWDPILSV